MAFKGITFAGQNVTPKNDGGLYQAHYGDGILWGCSMSLSGDDLVIQSGEFIMGGRVVQVDGATSVDLSGRSLTTGYIQVVMNADLSQGEGSQWYTTFVESATTTFPALTQDDINNTGTLYQLALAVVQISGGNLTSITDSLRSSFVNVYDADGYRRGQFRANQDVTALEVLDNAGDVQGGVIFNKNNSKGFLYGNGGGVVLMPNGLNDTTHQVELDANGQFHGGATLYEDYKASESVSANATNVGIAKLASLPKGIYIVSGYVRHQSATSNVALKRIGFATVSGAFGLSSNTFVSNTTSAVEYGMTIIWELTYTQDIWFNWGAFSTNGTITAHRFQALKIA